MEYALVIGGTSGIGKKVANYLSGNGILTIITGSRENYLKENKHELYVQHNQINSVNLSEKISSITNSIKYIFVSTGVFVPDDGDKLDLKMMEIINYRSNMGILGNLFENSFFTKDTKIIVNSSIQSQEPREFSVKYAESKKKLTDDAIKFGKKNKLQITVIGPSVVKDTPMAIKGINYYASKKYHGDINLFMKETKLKMTNISDIINVVEKIFFSKNDFYKKHYIHKFIPINHNLILTNTKGQIIIN